ncbi:hypothetical protein BU25DRAFT_469006 [Macroventuria anomochaeta]|uniref:Uncharacterized protein n=1 Tax=Macroventuria anomochaeta TaxID=301207 RepID=A0ACB6S1Q6_9PLEO|nr:uncharacterized protein BU25DRAFT_469006 [Macroventuria anomochaeta]KAF2627329.1 hypothetical protein BU25DRAFT_469006 [Macroventuria anomochaeta]
MAGDRNIIFDKTFASSDIIASRRVDKNYVYKGQHVRRITDTSIGMALMPRISIADDSIFLLEGASVPFVLRRAKGQDEASTNEYTWEVIGPAYVRGVMQGALGASQTSHKHGASDIDLSAVLNLESISG